MSAYAELQTQYKDKDCLIAALKEMGYDTVEDHEKAQNLYGYHGDMRNEKANIIVRRQYVGSAANDLGFVKKDDGTYGAIVSQYDSNKHNATWFTGLKKHYTEKVTMKTAAKRGLKFAGRSIVNGKIQLKFIQA